MSLVKELVDLVTQLDQMHLENRVRELVTPLKDKSSQVLQLNTDLDRKHFDEITYLHGLISDLRIQNSDIAAKYSIIQIEHAQLQSDHSNLQKEHADLKASKSIALPDSPSAPDYTTTPRPLDPCPHCRRDSGVLIKTLPHRRFRSLGSMEDHFKCSSSSCGREYQKPQKQ